MLIHLMNLLKLELADSHLIHVQTLFIHLFSFAYRCHCEYAKFNLRVDNAYGITHERFPQFNQVKSSQW